MPVGSTEATYGDVVDLAKDPSPTIFNRIHNKELCTTLRTNVVIGGAASLLLLGPTYRICCGGLAADCAIYWEPYQRIDTTRETDAHATIRDLSNFFATAVCIACVGLSSVAIAGSEAYVGTKATQNLSIDQIDHGPWNKLLTKYVDDNGMVNYRGWKASTADVQLLNQYLRHLSAASPRVSATKEAKLAFWINAYNAVTIRGILREYPTTSIRNHTPKFFGYNIWQDLKLYIGGTPYSLEDIEHENLRKMSEPRIHFAIVCASIGCPRLLNEAYDSDRIEEQLSANAKDFFSRTQNFRYNTRSNRFQLSSILNWFDEDFGSSQRQLLKSIAPWLPTEQARAAARSGTVTISYLTYDWNLNSQ